MPTIDEVPLTHIHMAGETQARERLDREVIADYAEAMTEGAQFPPVVLFFDGDGGFWIGDGFHRCHAAQQVGFTTIRAEVHQGGPRAAKLYAASANLTHGLRRTNADKRRAVLVLLDDDEWRQWSDRAIARHCGVDHKSVAKWRCEFTGEIPSERTYTTKHGTVATMDTSRIGSREATIAPMDGKAAAVEADEADADEEGEAEPIEDEAAEDAWEAEVEARPVAPGGANGHPPTQAEGRWIDPLAKVHGTLSVVLAFVDSDDVAADMLRTWSAEHWQRLDERVDIMDALWQRFRTAYRAMREKGLRPEAP
jgi:hypothetical protein